MSNEEAAFLKVLADTPEDETARGAYADWLDEQSRGEEAAKQRLMAPGYRAIVQMKLVPDRQYVPNGNCAYVASIVDRSKDSDIADSCFLPDDWFNQIKHRARKFDLFPYHGICTDMPEAELFQEIAIAFSFLPAERQAELLALPMVTCQKD